MSSPDLRHGGAPLHWFVTGASGLLGGRALHELLAADPRVRATLLVRDPARRPALLAALGPLAHRVRMVAGDVTEPGLGLAAETRDHLCGLVDGVLHAAADTTFSRPLADARRVNTQGTARLLELAEGWPLVRRVVHLSTAFVAGRHTGHVDEKCDAPAAGWVNSYERSKAEAERLVRDARGTRGDWLVLRPSTVVCDDPGGAVSQVNSVHRALRVYRAGLAAMMPHAPGTTLDAVPADWVAAAIAALARRADVAAETIHLCAGEGALPLEELLDVTYARWARDDGWRRRAIPRPALVDLATYELFAQTVEETGDRRLCQVLRSLSHFVPQLGFPKQFDTRRVEQLLERPAPAVREYWPRMIDHLLAVHWRAPVLVAA